MTNSSARVLAVFLGAISLGLLAFSGPALAEPVSREQVMAAVPKLEDLINDVVAKGGVPGLSVAVVFNDEVVYLKGFGVRDMGMPAKVDADTVFQLASVSKPISATVVAKLVSDGKLDWNSRISDLDPDFKLHDPYPTAEVTVRDMFAHRSGLPGGTGNDLEEIGYDRSTIMQRLRYVPAWVSFRGGYSYSNMGITEGGLAAARASGEDWETAAENSLYKPLGMNATSSRYSDFEKRANRASLHVDIDGKWVALVKRNADAQSPAGGVSSTARDMAQWVRLELEKGQFDGKQLISESAINATHEPLMSRGLNPVSGATSFYGLGWNVEFGRHGLSWGHAGAFSTGARTVVTIYPDAGFGIVVLTNAFPTGVPDGISDSFADLVFDGKISKDWVMAWNEIYAGLLGKADEAARKLYAKPPAQSSQSLASSAYVGTYSNDYVGTADVVAENGDLVLKLGPEGKASYHLTHFDRDIFVAYASPETPDVPSPVQFTVGPNGSASSVTIDFLNGLGLGTLTRNNR